MKTLPFTKIPQDDNKVYRLSFLTFANNTESERINAHQGVYRNVIDALQRGQFRVSKASNRLLDPSVAIVTTSDEGHTQYHIESHCGDVVATVSAEPLL